jgi:hypothetical protein
VVNRASARLCPLPPMVEEPVEERGLFSPRWWPPHCGGSGTMQAPPSLSRRKPVIAGSASLSSQLVILPRSALSRWDMAGAPLLRYPHRGPWREGIVGGGVCCVPGFRPWEEADWCILGVATMFLACCNWLFSCSNYLSFMLQSLNMLYPRS